MELHPIVIVRNPVGAHSERIRGRRGAISGYPEQPEHQHVVWIFSERCNYMLMADEFEITDESVGYDEMFELRE
jgi:hypothetical protein